MPTFGFATAVLDGAPTLAALSGSILYRLDRLLEKAPDLKLGDDLAGQIALFFARMRGSEKLLALLEKTGTVAKADGSVPLP